MTNLLPLVIFHDIPKGLRVCQYCNAIWTKRGSGRHVYCPTCLQRRKRARYVDKQHPQVLTAYLELRLATLDATPA